MADSLTYLYGIVPADAPGPPEDLRGVEQHAVRLLRAGGVAGIIGTVPVEEYSEPVLDERLTRLEWVGERGLAHERVLAWFADRGPVIPLSPFSLHQDEERIRQRIEEGAAGFREALERLTGRREWGVKLWRVDSEVEKHLDELSPRLRDLARELESAPPGRRFLLAKKKEALRSDALREVSAEAAQEVFADLQAEAEDAVRIPLPTRSPASERALVLHAAFFVADPAFPAFQHRITALAQRYQPYGFVFEFTGPWPPYHFARSDVS